MNSAFFTFDYDYDAGKWNLPRGTVPSQLKAQGVPHALWMHFWDYSQSVVERSSVRAIMKKKLRLECSKGNLSAHRTQEREAEITKLDEQTERDFECLQRQAERLFPNSKARVTSESGKRFGLEIRLLHASANASDNLQLHYDDKSASWNLPRDVLPASLESHGVPLADWIAIWDYGFGVNQRAKEREHLNQLHDRELNLCHKSLSYMNSTKIPSVDNNAVSNHNSTANHIRTKMDKLEKAKEANGNNTKKGWQELQRRAAQRFEPYGVKVYLSRQDEEICCGLQFQCPKPQQQRSATTDSNLGMKRRSLYSYTTPSAIWLPTSSPIPSPPHRERTSPTPSIWMTVPRYPSPKKHVDDDSSTSAVLQPKTPDNIQKENSPPPKPEAARKPRKKAESTLSSRSGVWGQPVVLTYVHEDVPSRVDIEVSAPLTPTSSHSFDDEDSHGYVVPPAPSSIGSSSSESMSMSTHHKALLLKKLPRHVHFGENKWHTYECPGYTKTERKNLWFTHEERDASRSNTKQLAQRVIDNRNSGGANNVVFMDSDTEEEVCWRGLEHAKKGNLSSRQETRRSFLIKVLEKQRLLQLDSWTSRRGTVEDPAGELQKYASRQSRECRERAHKLAAQDAKEARTVYKESLRKTNFHHHQQHRHSSGVSVASVSSSRFSQSQASSSHYHQRSHHHHHQALYHQNDIFQDYCRQMHLATKTRLHQQPVM